MELDLCDLSAIKKSAAEFLEKEKELHILYNNACAPHLRPLPLSIFTDTLQWSNAPAAEPVDGRRV